MHQRPVESVRGALTRAEIERHARPGETWEEARERLCRAREDRAKEKPQGDLT
jgi:hypothetical protein